MTNLPIQRARAAILLVVLFLAMNVLPARAQNSDAVADLAARINRERVTRGLAPLALNAKLTASAQAHADDVARNGRTRNASEGHIGSDGSTVFDRVARTGYGAYSWGRRLGENWAWYRSASEATAMWMDSPSHRANILHPLYREMGIGIAPNPTIGFVYVIDFGVQPSVLPIFINDGASETKSLDVKLTLTSEQVAPNGDGDNIGQPVQVMISNAADFAGAQWQPFAAAINWTLAPNGGTKTVYVKYRDAKGRIATASDSIAFGAVTAPTTIATRSTPTRTPTSTVLRSTVAAKAAVTETPSEFFTMTATVTATVGGATDIPTLVATEPSASATPTVTRAASPNPVAADPTPSFDWLGIAVAFVMAVVLIRVWAMANH